MHRLRYPLILPIESQRSTETSTQGKNLFPCTGLAKHKSFTEHMGRCIYGGIYDPENPNKDLVTADGFRKDVLDALKPLKIPVVRW